ncbi:MAG: beta-eliminating lyase-related protein, partial [Rhodospirillales bacterium]|nr:beta-eliminating lyase-related protein [Rhodospirillales bacterium]
MNFCSDNVTGAAPEILAAIAEANQGPAAAYGEDPLTRRVEARIAEVFGCEADVYLVATGTAANAMSLYDMVPPIA